MELSMKKYIEYLESKEKEYFIKSISALKDALFDPDILDEAKENFVETATNRMKTNFLKAILTIPLDEWKESKKIFADFELLSNDLISSSLKDREKVNVIFEVIRRNISTGIAEEEIDADIFGITTNDPEIEKSELFKRFVNDNNSYDSDNLLEFLNEKIEEIGIEKTKETFNCNIVNMFENARCFRILKIYYFDKIDSFNRDDIVPIIESLRKLNVTDEMCDIVTSVLIKKIIKREKTPTKKTNIVLTKEENTKRSFNDIQQELLKYYNFSDSYITSDKRISLDEIINCVVLLSDLGAHKEQLYTFIKAANIFNNMFEINPINLYNEQYYRMQYYKEKLGLCDSFQNMQDLYQELFLLGDEDYSFGKNMLKDELSQFMKQIPSNSDYEIERAKVKIKERTQK